MTADGQDNMSGSAAAGSPDVRSRLTSARRRLSYGLSGASLEDADPDPPLRELNALAGFGAVVTGRDLHLSVYLLDGWGQGHRHAAELRAQAEERGRAARVAVNGDLLLLASIPADANKADRFLLTDICSAFAGRE